VPPDPVEVPVPEPVPLPDEPEPCLGADVTFARGDGTPQPAMSDTDKDVVARNTAKNAEDVDQHFLHFDSTLQTQTRDSPSANSYPLSLGFVEPKIVEGEACTSTGLKANGGPVRRPVPGMGLDQDG